MGRTCGGTQMSPSLRALLSGSVDYAGLFPPARLPLDQAIRNYARYRTDPQGPPVLTPCYEAGFATDWRVPLSRVLTALKEDNYSVAAETRTRWRLAGFKLRCGGPDASAFPTPEQVACVLATCSDSVG